MKLKWKHKQTIGKIKIIDEEVIRMLKLGATFELTPAYTVYYKNGKEKKIKLNHLSIRLKKWSY